MEVVEKDVVFHLMFVVFACWVRLEVHYLSPVASLSGGAERSRSGLVMGESEWRDSVAEIKVETWSGEVCGRVYRKSKIKLEPEDVRVFFFLIRICMFTVAPGVY